MIGVGNPFKKLTLESESDQETLPLLAWGTCEKSAFDSSCAAGAAFPGALLKRGEKASAVVRP